MFFNLSSVHCMFTLMFAFVYPVKKFCKKKNIKDLKFLSMYN